MKQLILFFLSICVGIGCIFAYIIFTTTPQTQSYITPVSHHTSFSLDTPPSDSLRGNIATMSGTVDWESRSATQPATLHSSPQIEQGEDIATETDGTALVQFPTCCSMQLSPLTHLSFVQTLPANIVIAQSQGSVEYATTNIPVSVRSLSLLITMTNDDIVFTMSKTQPILSIFVKKGLLQASYNDLQYNSTVIPVTEGQTFIFNDTTRSGNVE